jgi:hypothetical protein
MRIALRKRPEVVKATRSGRVVKAPNLRDSPAEDVGRTPILRIRRPTQTPVLDASTDDEAYQLSSDDSDVSLPPRKMQRRGTSQKRGSRIRDKSVVKRTRPNPKSTPKNKPAVSLRSRGRKASVGMCSIF